MAGVVGDLPLGQHALHGVGDVLACDAHRHRFRCMYRDLDPVAHSSLAEVGVDEEGGLVGAAGQR